MRNLEISGLSYCSVRYRCMLWIMLSGHVRRPFHLAGLVWFVLVLGNMGVSWPKGYDSGQFKTYHYLHTPHLAYENCVLHVSRKALIIWVPQLAEYSCWFMYVMGCSPLIEKFTPDAMRIRYWRVLAKCKELHSKDYQFWHPTPGEDNRICGLRVSFLYLAHWCSEDSFGKYTVFGLEMISNWIHPTLMRTSSHLLRIRKKLSPSLGQTFLGNSFVYHAFPVPRDGSWRGHLNRLRTKKGRLNHRMLSRGALGRNR